MLAGVIILNLKNRIFFDVKTSVPKFLFGASFFHWTFDADIGGCYSCLEEEKQKTSEEFIVTLWKGTVAKSKRQQKKYFMKIKRNIPQNIQY